MAKGFGAKGGAKSFSKGGGSSRSHGSRSSLGGGNRSSGARFSFGSGGGGGRRSWFSAPGSPGHTGGSRPIWDDAGPEVMREGGPGGAADLEGLAELPAEAIDAYRERDWARFWWAVAWGVAAIVVVVAMLAG